MTTIPDTYEQSRERFYDNLAMLRDLWPASRLTSHSLPGAEDLSIDWISARATKRKDKLLILTTGEHGIEGYVGSAMMQLFVEEYLSRLNPAETGLLLVHAINPWGMKHHRRVNASNVDLNRNFVKEIASLAPSNPDYALLDSFLNPPRPFRDPTLHKMALILRAPGLMLRFGVAKFRAATLLGQYRFSKGVYFGGQRLQEETLTMMELFRDHIRDYAQVLHLDMHTGYGPRDQMTLVNSCYEKMTSEDAVRRYGYPLVAAATAQEFYAIQGDMIDYLYTVMREEFPGKRSYATTFEFGTFGTLLWDNIRELRTMIFENRAHWFGVRPSARAWLRREFDELYCPSEPAWFEKAQADARQAFSGILKAEGYI
jgi:murein tripeptide amidase MpaA